MASVFSRPGADRRSAVHVLPEPLDVLRIAADQPAGALLQHVLRSAFADARDSGVGFDGDHHIALIEQRIGIRRQVGAHPRDLHFRKSAESGQRADSSRDRDGCQGTDKSPPFHGFESWLACK